MGKAKKLRSEGSLGLKGPTVAKVAALEGMVEVIVEVAAKEGTAEATVD